MRSKVHNRWENLRTSLWFLPSLLGALALLLAEQVPSVERATPIHAQVAAIRDRASQQAWHPADQQQVEQAVDRALRAVHGRPSS